MRHAVSQGAEPRIVEEGLAELERPPADVDLGLAIRLDPPHAVVAQLAQHVRRIGRRADGDDRLGRGDVGRRGQDCRAAKTSRPISRLGGQPFAVIAAAAATTSSTSAEKPRAPNAPSLSPSPVKSNRNTATP